MSPMVPTFRAAACVLALAAAGCSKKDEGPKTPPAPEVSVAVVTGAGGCGSTRATVKPPRPRVRARLAPTSPPPETITSNDEEDMGKSESSDRQCNAALPTHAKE